MLIIYAMSLWFLILLFSDKNYLWCSLIILMSVLANITIIDIFYITKEMSFIQEVGLLLKLDGITAIALTYFFARDKLALRMCLLLTFAVICHFMVIYESTVAHSYVSGFFYSNYEAFIAATGLLQMAITINGITSAPRNIWRHLQRLDFYFWCYSKGLSVFKIVKHS